MDAFFHRLLAGFQLHDTGFQFHDILFLTLSDSPRQLRPVY
jgi:hypothetical protein